MKAKQILLLFMLMISAISCSSAKKISTIPIQKDSIVYVEKLVPVTIPADSSSVYALFECDSTNKVIMKELTEEKTKNLQTYTDFKTDKNKRSTLVYKIKTVHDTIYVKQIDNTIYKEKPIPYPVEKEINVLHLWQKILMWCGVTFLILLIIAIYRKFKKLTDI